MTYPAFQIASADSAVTAVIGASPVRLWPFGHVPQNEVRPYAVHQLVYGNPDNSLSCIPKEDLAGVQFDCYGKTASQAQQVFNVLRDAYEATFNHVVSYNGEEWEQATGLYRVSFTVEFWTERSS